MLQCCASAGWLSVLSKMGFNWKEMMRETCNSCFFLWRHYVLFFFPIEARWRVVEGGITADRWRAEGDFQCNFKFDLFMSGQKRSDQLLLLAPQVYPGRCARMAVIHRCMCVCASACACGCECVCIHMCVSSRRLNTERYLFHGDGYFPMGVHVGVCMWFLLPEMLFGVSRTSLWSQTCRSPPTHRQVKVSNLFFTP